MTDATLDLSGYTLRTFAEPLHVPDVRIVITTALDPRDNGVYRLTREASFASATSEPHAPHSPTSLLPLKAQRVSPNNRAARRAQKPRK